MGPPLYGAIPLLLEGLDWEGSVPDLVLPKGREVSGPNWVLPGANGGRLGGLGCRLELAGALSRAGWGSAGVGSKTGLSGTGAVSVRAWRAVTCHSSTSPRHTGSYVHLHVHSMYTSMYIPCTFHFAPFFCVIIYISRKSAC